MAHRLASLLHLRPVLGKLTDNDLYAELRQRGVFDLGQVRYVLYEAKGGLTVVPRQSTTLPPLVVAGLHSAAG